MSFCRFCGKELINGQCDCPKFQASMENESANQYQEQKDPFLVSGFQTDFSSFSAFVSSMRDQTGMSEPTSNVSDPFEHNVPIVPDCIQKEDNEIVVKQYNIAKLRTRLKFMKAEGRLMVTNRRILFRAAGTSLTGNILQEHQFNIDEISGIQIHKDYKFSILSFIGCFLLNFFALSLGRGRSEGNVYFITDEFRLLPNLEHVDDAVNFGRSLGIRFMIGIQNVEQIYDNYGEERAHSIMSGFMTSLNFRVNDPKSREHIKQQFGMNRKIEAYVTNVQSKGMIEERRDGYVVEDWDLTNLKIGQAVIGFPENEPFVFQFDLWNA